MKFYSWLGAAAVLLLAGCVSEVVERKQYGFGYQEEKYYPPVKNAQLALELPERQLIAGSSGELVFALVNKGTKAVTIREWYKHEPYNILLDCQVWFPGTENPDPQMWVRFSPPVKHPAFRYPRTILPGEKLFCSVWLPFVSKLVVSPNAERRYFIRAKLNLTSVSTNVIDGAIAVKAPENTPRKGLKRPAPRR